MIFEGSIKIKRENVNTLEKELEIQNGNEGKY